MAFKFPLHQVLKYRTQLEQEAKIHFARMEHERLREEQRLEEISQALIEQQAKLASLSGTNIDERWFIENFIRGLRQDMLISQKQLQNWQKQVEEARKLLTEKAKDKKILEKLKEKQEEKYAQEEKYQEQKFFDEITAGKEARNS